MRKHVTPADPAAMIPDPERGQPLPPDGRAVPWSAYWAGLEMRRDVTAVALPDEPEPGPEAAEAAASEPPPPATA